MTHPNATPGKAIYLDGMIYEGYAAPSKEHGINESPSYDYKYLCHLPNPFTNNQVLTEGVDYVKQRQIRALGLTEWNNCTQKEYEAPYHFPQERRIICLPVQPEGKEGEKEVVSERKQVAGFKVMGNKTYHLYDDGTWELEQN